jgi:hypothetical protein
MKNTSPCVEQTWNQSIKMTFSDTFSVAYRHGSTLPKAALHPLKTPKGHVLTGFEMSDHVWHRALWFTIKLINGANYWEELEEYGVQTSLAEPQVRRISESLTKIEHDLVWTSKSTGTVFRERREIFSSVDAEGINHLEWESDLLAEQDLILDRTPFTTWGGYSGLAFRGSREMHEARFMIPGGEKVELLTGKSLDWVVLEGKMDGGADEKVSLGIVDDSQNPNSPSPWYCKSSNGFTFMNPAFIFHGPLSLKKGEHLRFRYKIVFRDGVWTSDEFQKIADQFRNQ